MSYFFLLLVIIKQLSLFPFSWGDLPGVGKGTEWSRVSKETTSNRHLLNTHKEVLFSSQLGFFPHSFGVRETHTERKTSYFQQNAGKPHSILRSSPLRRKERRKPCRATAQGKFQELKKSAAHLPAACGRAVENQANAPFCETPHGQILAITPYFLI